MTDVSRAKNSYNFVYKWMISPNFASSLETRLYYYKPQDDGTLPTNRQQSQRILLFMRIYTFLT